MKERKEKIFFTLQQRLAGFPYKIHPRHPCISPESNCDLASCI